MTNEERARATALKIAAVLKSVEDEDNPFDEVGVSEDFLATHLPNSEAKSEDIAQLRESIEEAVRNEDTSLITQIVGTVEDILSPLTAIFLA